MTKNKFELDHNILDFIKDNPNCSSMKIYENALHNSSLATIKRLLKKNVDNHNIIVIGIGKNTRYHISVNYQFLYPINVEAYFTKEIDERTILKTFNFQICEQLQSVTIFTDAELQKLQALQTIFYNNTKDLEIAIYQKELQRLAIDLSWKSSQIEGNTYSLLETERLLVYKEFAVGKTKEEAIMLLNHKIAIDFIADNTDYLINLSISKIEDIHSLLVSDLNIDKNIRKRQVGITGTNYKPIDNEFQIRDAVEAMCTLINSKSNIFEKAFLSLILLSYIQAFNDGNKRTARIVSNAIFFANNYCPLSFRSVSTLEYKKAMLIFYEQNNIQPFKNLFIKQVEFAVQTYF
jgi:Fic family protein